MNRHCLTFGTVCLLSLQAVHAGDYDPFAPAITIADLDLEQCATWHDGKRQPVKSEKLKQALGLVEMTSRTEGWNRAWSAGRAGMGADRYRGDTPKAETFHYRIAFRRPVAIGSVLCSNQSLHILKDGAPFPGDPAVPEHWRSISIPPLQRGISVTPFPKGVKTRAVLLSDHLKRGTSQAWPVRIYRHRLFNIAHAASVAAKSEYLAPTNRGGRLHRAAHVVRGKGPWFSTGVDDRGNVRGAFISDVEPSWFAMAWERPRPVVGVFSRDNFVTLQFEKYRGPEKGNPLVAREKQWRRVKSRFRGGQKLFVRSDRGRWSAFNEPVELRGLRLKILKAWKRTGGGSSHQTQIAELQSLLVLTDLKDAPVPDFDAAGPSRPPYRIAYDLQEPGTVTLVVDSEDGRRVRNLMARVLREDGGCEERWDLKDEDGHFVKPGNYRWKAITGPELRLTYEQAVYPNVSVHHPENAPWLNGHAGPGGWLADHSPPRGVCAGGDYTFFCAPVPESGVGFAACDINGKKLWGIHSFGAWTGGHRVVSDGKKVYVEAFGWHGEDAGADRVWEVDAENHKVTEVFRARTDERRVRGCEGIALHDGKVFLSINAKQKWLTNAVGMGAIDINRCLPFYREARKPKYPYEIVPNPRGDFLRLFRFTGTPPGYAANHGLTYLHSVRGPERQQHILLAFNKPVQIGSCVYPVPQSEELHVKLSVLKAASPYPPDPDKEEQWHPFESNGKLPWDVAVAPPDTSTRALRITFVKGDDNEFAALEAELEDDEKSNAWEGRLEGFQMLRRRYRNLFASAKVRVSSGQVDKQGVWVARRDRPLSKSDPEIYLMNWDAPQKVRGLAIKEIDCSLTEVDVWNGPAGARIEMAGTQHWQMVGKYIPRRRMQHSGFGGHNADARYMDGVVDFGREVTTRAIRLRVVEQWTTPTREGSCAKDLLGLDASRCRLFGVAPLQFLGGEPPVESLMTERLEILNPASKKIEKEIAISKPGDLDFDADGSLYALSAGKLVKVNLDGGEHQALAEDLMRPTSIAVDGRKQIYVFDAAKERKVIRVYSAEGKHLRSIGTPGGYRAGPWDPTRFENLSSMAVDKEEKLWVVDRNYWPKRVACFTTGGTHLRDILGPTAYGGGGVLDPHDKTRLVYGPLEFKLDWGTGTSRLANLLTTGPWMWVSGEVHIPIRGRDYFVTRPQGPGFTRPVGVVYLHEKERLRPVAAVGYADQFSPLKQQSIIDSLDGKLLTELEFIWADQNGDGVVDVNEVDFEPRTIWPLTRFNDDLGVQAGHFRFVVDRFLDNGAPLYKKSKTTLSCVRGYMRGVAFRFNDGSFYRLGNEFPDTGYNAKGEQIWAYPNEGTGVGPDRSCRPFSTGQVVCQFAMVGHETAAKGDLGEFFVINANLGSWNVWTKDGLLATRIFRDLRDEKRIAWSMKEHHRGLDLSNVAAGQEHFSGWLCRARQDGKYYAVAGHHWAGVVEVKGLDEFKRIGGTLAVTPEDVAAAMKWERQVARYRARDEVKIYDCNRTVKPPLPRGKVEDWKEVTKVALNDYTQFGMTYDDQYLHLYYTVMRKPELVNRGERWDRLFKTGSCVDLMLSTDPDADAARRAPVKGDIRLLFSRMNDRPIAVLYNAVKPGTKADDRWTITSPVTSVQFDEVKKLEGAYMRYTRHTPHNSDAVIGFTLDAAVPLKSIGLTITPDLLLKMDWGYLESDPAGTQVLARHYWSNKATSTLADAPSEARLQPDLWGYVRFHGKAKSSGAGVDLGDLLGEKEEGDDEDSVFEDLEED